MRKLSVTFSLILFGIITLLFSMRINKINLDPEPCGELICFIGDLLNKYSREHNNTFPTNLDHLLKTYEIDPNECISIKDKLCPHDKNGISNLFYNEDIIKLNNINNNPRIIYLYEKKPMHDNKYFVVNSTCFLKLVNKHQLRELLSIHRKEVNKLLLYLNANSSKCAVQLKKLYNVILKFKKTNNRYPVSLTEIDRDILVDIRCPSQQSGNALCSYEYNYSVALDKLNNELIDYIILSDNKYRHENGKYTLYGNNHVGYMNKSEYEYATKKMRLKYENIK